MAKITTSIVRDRSGAVAVFVALGLTAVTGFAAIAVDGSYLYVERHRLEVAAETAALAAVSALPDEDDAQAAALEFAEANYDDDVLDPDDVEFGHFDDDTKTFTAGGTPVNAAHVTTRRSESNGNPVGLFFASIIGFDYVDVSADAIAVREGSPGEACIMSLKPSGPGGIEISGTVNLDISCGLAAHSTHATQGMKFNGTVDIDVTGICVAGGAQVSGTVDFVSATPVEDCTPPPDPLTGLAPPLEAALPCTQTNFKVSSNGGIVIMTPGVYCNGIEVSGNSNDITFLPGTYVLAGGGFKVSGGSNELSGDGVMFYNTKKGGFDFEDVDFSGNNTVSLSAATIGDYAGVLFFQDPSAASAAASIKFKVSGTVTTNWDGAVYFPDHAIEYSGTTDADQTCATKFIGDTVKIAGTVGFTSEPDCASSQLSISGGELGGGDQAARLRG